MQSTKATPASILEAIQLPEELSLRKYWLVMKRRWLVIALISGGSLGLASVATLRQSPTYEASGKLLFKPDGSQALVGIENEKTGTPLQGLTQKSDPLSTQAEIIKSESISKATVKALKLKDEQGNPKDYRQIASGLTVKPIVGSDILQVSYNSTDPELAASIVNQVMKAYIARNVESTRRDAIAARNFIREQLPGTEKSVNQAEANLRQFKEANGVVALDQEAEAAVQGLSQLDQQITQAQADVRQANAKAAQLRNQVGMNAASALTLSKLSQAEGVQKALTDWQLAQAQLAKQQTLYRGLHPSVGQFQRQEQAAKAVLQERVADVLGRRVQLPPGQLQQGRTKEEIVAELAKAEVDQWSVAQRLQALVRSQAVYAKRSSSLPALEKTERELRRQLDAAQTTYKSLLAKLQEVQIAANQKVGNAEIVSNAEIPDSPVSPRVVINLLAGGVFGLLLGIAAAFLIDYRDQSVRTMREARDLFKYTLLGVIPTIEMPSDADPEVPNVITREHSSFAAQEAYQMLQANLRFLTSETLRSIVVTSAVGKEGKSTVAANLAAAMAQVKQRVLLVDANFRTPCQHRVWNFTNLIGLSNVIVDQVRFDAAIQQVTPHLHLLPAGVIPPNPVSLLDSRQMEELIEQFTQIYDFVIFDAPSLSGTVDSTVLNKMTDGTLFVVRPGTIDAATGKAAKEYLTQSGQKVLGMVINHFDVSKEPDSYFYHNKKEIARMPAKQDRAEIRL
jgi:capsular exopolysaccharide synthesis family protein